MSLTSETSRRNFVNALFDNTPGNTPIEKEPLVRVSVSILRNLIEIHKGRLFDLDCYLVGLTKRPDFKQIDVGQAVDILINSGIIIQAEGFYHLDTEVFSRLAKVLAKN